MSERRRSVLAIAAHPDDIEFGMAGTVLLLRRAGWEAHYFNIASGNCGSMVTGPEETARVREGEARAAAAILGAAWHAPLCGDLEIEYTAAMVRRVLAVVRRAAPAIVLTHPLQDYMEDHMLAARLAVTAAFSRGFPNFPSDPPEAPVSGDVAVYHAMPHSLRDPLRQRVRPELYVNTGDVHSVKREALAAHRSQKEWLDATQGMDSYLAAMDGMSLAVGDMSGSFRHAEGWRRHLHYGFSAADGDPLAEALGGDCLADADYRAALERARS